MSTRYFTQRLATTLAVESGLPVTSSVRKAEAILVTGGTLLLVLTPTTEWETYTDGEAACTLVIAAGPTDDDATAQAALDEALIPVMDALNACSWGTDKITPAGYASTRGDSQTWPAYTVTFTVPLTLDDLKEN